MDTATSRATYTRLVVYASRTNLNAAVPPLTKCLHYPSLQECLAAPACANTLALQGASQKKSLLS